MYLSRDDTMAVLYARMTGTRPTSEAAERASEWSLLRLAGAHLERLGVSTRALSPEEIFTRASGSDFPVLVESTLNRVARGAYDSYPGGLRKIARTVAAPDFRARGSVVLSEAAALQPVDEGAYFAESKWTARKESYALATYGLAVSTTSQLLRNDDVGAFADMAGTFGRGAAEFVNKKLAILLESNPVMSDGNACLHATHGNIAAAAAFSEASLGELMKMVFAQKGPNGQSIATAPRFVIVPPALTFAAYKLVATITPPGSPPPLEVLVEPRLTSATAFYVASDPAVLPCLEAAYLDGDEGPVIELKTPFKSTSAKWRVRLDYGAGVVEHRAIAMNPGA